VPAVNQIEEGKKSQDQSEFSHESNAQEEIFDIVHVEVEPSPVSIKVEPSPVSIEVKPSPVHINVEPSPVNVKVEPSLVHINVEPCPIHSEVEPSFVKVNNEDNYMKVPKVYNDDNRASVISIPSERKSMESETLFKKFRSITNKGERFKQRISKTCMVVFLKIYSQS
jgi:hypothetical protein